MSFGWQEMSQSTCCISIRILIRGMYSSPEVYTNGVAQVLYDIYIYK